jgi:hypothetical protein
MNIESRAFNVERRIGRSRCNVYERPPALHRYVRIKQASGFIYSKSPASNSFLAIL